MFAKGGQSISNDSLFKEEIGAKSLISQTKMIPMDILDNIEGTLTMSKLQNFEAYVRPQSSLQKQAEQLKIQNKQARPNSHYKATGDQSQQ